MRLLRRLNLAGSRSIATEVNITKEWIARDFIWDVLYSPGVGYFNKEERIFTPPGPMCFGEIKDQQAYRIEIEKMYSDTARWSTPVELFKPHYAKALANWTLRTIQKPEQGIHVVEMGGGTGTFAVGFLDHIRESNRALYEKSAYTSIDASSTMMGLLQNALGSSNHLQGPLRVDFKQGSALDALKEGIHADGREVVIIGNEVLDNMPHDKVILENDTFKQVHVLEDSNGELHEEIRPLTDPWITEYLETVPLDIILDTKKSTEVPSLWDRMFNMLLPIQNVECSLLNPNQTEIFLPTYAFQVLKAIQRFPNHHLLLADFNELIDDIGGINGPCVGSQVSGRAGTRVDYPDYLVPIGSADIFFPTNFKALQKSYQSIHPEKQCDKLYSHASFMKEFANTDETRTLSGYNPLISEYPNASFFSGSKYTK